MFRLFVLFYLFIFVVSCNQKRDLSYDKYQLVIKDTLILPLDSKTPAHSASINFIDAEEPLLVFFSEKSEELLFYAIKDKKLVKRTLLQREGKNSIGEGKIGVHFINNDSIIVATSGYQVSIIDSDGNLKYKNSFLRDNLLVQPKIGTNYPVVIDNNKMYVGSLPYIDTENLDEFKKAFCLTEVNLTNGLITPLTKYPDIYQRNLYGINFVAGYSYTYNRSQDKIVWSFPVADSVYVQDVMKNTIEAYYCPSKYFSYIKPSKEKNMQDAAAYTKFFVQSNSYGPIYYDKYKKLYYRFAERGVDKIRYEEKKWWKYNSIIILNEYFEKLGETDISENATNIQCFITPKGLYIYEYQENSEDSIFFIRYEIEKNEN